MTTTELWTFRDQAIARIDLTGFELHALDGAFGTVAQSVEGSAGGYLVIDPGAAMPARRPLIVPVGLVEKVEVDERRVRVRADREQIRNSPLYEASQPLDKRWRTGMNEYYRPVLGGRGRARAAHAGTPAMQTSSRGNSRKSQTRVGSKRDVSSVARPRWRRTSEGQSRAELYAEARRLGIDGRSKMNKAQLARAVGRRQRGSTQAPAEPKANPVEVQAFLEGVGYPTRKRELVREAERQGARREVRVTLRRLPDKEFESPTEVSEAIGKL